MGQIIALIYLCGGVLAVCLFLVFVVYDRKVNQTPWNLFTVLSRIALFFALWPLYLVAGVVAYASD